MRRSGTVGVFLLVMVASQLMPRTVNADTTGPVQPSAVTPSNDRVGIFEAISLKRGSGLLPGTGFDATAIFQKLEEDLLDAKYAPQPHVYSSYDFADFKALAGDGIVILDMHTGNTTGKPGDGFLVFKQFTAGQKSDAEELLKTITDANPDMTGLVRVQAQHDEATHSVVVGWAVVITEQAVQKIFAGHHVSIFFNMSCDSKDWASDFGATDYLSYPGLCAQGVGQGWTDLQLFMNALLGKGGFSLRTSTQAAAGLSGVDLGPNPLPPITLAPAIDPISVDPPDKGSVTPGTKTSVSLHFDTQMKPEKGLVQLTGDCGKQAKISDEKWYTSQTYGFTLEVPKSVHNGEITLTVPKSLAVAAKPGWDSQLWGNENKNGKFPPSDYVWHLNCGQKTISVNVSGSQGGVSVDGQLLGTAAQDVQCNGAGDQESVIITGRASRTGAVSITIDGRTGTDPVNGTQYSSANVSAHVQGAYQDNANPDYNMGQGGGTVTIGASGGSINASLSGDGSLQISGSWTCPSSGTPA